MGRTSRGRILIAATALLWGLGGVCIKSVTWGTMSIVTSRSLISLIMLLFVKKSIRVELTRANVLGGLMMCLTGIIYVQAVKLTTAGTAIVLQYIAPIFIFIYEVVFRGKKPKAWEVLLTGFVFGGIVLTFSDSIDMTHVVGNLLALLSGVTFAAQIIIMSGEASSSEDCTVIGNTLSFLICLPFMINDPALSFDRVNILWILVLGVFQYGLANAFFSKGCKLINDIECSILLTIEPIFNPILVAAVHGERMGTLSVMGAAAVIISVTLYAVIPELRRQK